MADRDPRVLAIDAGGTMTDTFIVDEAGSLRGRQGADDARGRVGRLHGVGRATRSSSGTRARRRRSGGSPPGSTRGTAMLNRLLSRSGRDIGAIVTAGNEDYLRIERGIQTYLGFSYSDRLHLATHHHNEPIVPREQMKGVRGRIDVMGTEVLPLREADVREAAAELLDAGVEGICICSAVRLPQRRARDPRRRDRRGGEGRARASTARCRSTWPRSSTRCAATCRGSTRP